MSQEENFATITMPVGFEVDVILPDSSWVRRYPLKNQIVFNTQTVQQYSGTDPLGFFTDTDNIVKPRPYILIDNNCVLWYMVDREVPPTPNNLNI